MTGKQRALLRSAANAYETVLFVGKNGVTEDVTKQADEALEAREMIKGKVHETCELSPREVCGILCESLNAEPIQVIGTKFVIYRQNKNPDKRVIDLNNM